MNKPITAPSTAHVPPPPLRSAATLLPSRSVPPITSAELKQSAAQFVAHLTGRLADFHRHIPPGPNPALTLHFLEDQVCALLAARLAPRRLVSGTIRPPVTLDPEANVPFLRDIIYDPQLGPSPIDTAGFSIIKPAACAGVIRIQPCTHNTAKFEAHLRDIALNLIRNRHPSRVMGIVIADPDPEKKSIVRRKGRTFQAHEFTSGKWCPIYILFTRRGNTYQPYLPAIEALLANLSQFPPPRNAEFDSAGGRPPGPQNSVLRAVRIHSDVSTIPYS
jgi:hypothetical protein